MDAGGGDDNNNEDQHQQQQQQQMMVVETEEQDAGGAKGRSEWSEILDQHVVPAECRGFSTHFKEEFNSTVQCGVPTEADKIDAERRGKIERVELVLKTIAAPYLRRLAWFPLSHVTPIDTRSPGTTGSGSTTPGTPHMQSSPAVVADAVNPTLVSELFGGGPAGSVPVASKYNPPVFPGVIRVTAENLDKWRQLAHQYEAGQGSTSPAAGAASALGWASPWGGGTVTPGGSQHQQTPAPPAASPATSRESRVQSFCL
jgi:hypothetical protein